jgi:hypothetical protein
MWYNRTCVRTLGRGHAPIKVWSPRGVPFAMICGKHSPCMIAHPMPQAMGITGILTMWKASTFAPSYGNPNWWSWKSPTHPMRLPCSTPSPRSFPMMGKQKAWLPTLPKEPSGYIHYPAPPYYSGFARPPPPPIVYVFYILMLFIHCISMCFMLLFIVYYIVIYKGDFHG